MSRTTQRNNLQVFNPTLSKEWHPTKNGELTPQDITPGSNRKVWWLCKKGHEWQAVICSRNTGIGCPYCSGRVVTKETCLAKKHPELAAQWHATKNNPLTPQDVAPGSGKKVWWQCKKGHEWQAIVQSAVRSRTEGRGCPYCANKRVTKMNSLAQQNPTLSAQWHPTKNGTLTPNGVTCGSNKKVWWQCEKGHEWQSWIADRNSGRGCPYCSGRFARLDNNLQVRNPSLCKEWHPTKNVGRSPSDYTFSSGKKVWWRCKRGHEWEASIAHRNNGRACPFCNSQTSSIELQLYSELVMLFPDTLHRHKVNCVECDIYIPNIRVAIEVDGKYWHKDKEETDVRKLDALSKRNVLLIRLREKGLAIPRDLDLQYTRSDYGFPLVERVLLTIAKHVSDPSVGAAHQLYLKKGCLLNELGFKKLLNMLPGPLPGMSLSEKFPNLAAEWHPQRNPGLFPIDVASSSNLKVWWLCQKGHEWMASPNTRTRKGRKTTNCPYCTNRRFDKHGWHTSLADVNPVLATEWHTEKNAPLSAADVPPNYSKKVWWRCLNGHEWQTTPNQRSNRKSGCPFCAGQRATLETCLQTKNPELASEWHPTLNSPLTPTEVTIGSGRKVWWQCSRGHEWQAVVGERVKGRSCPFCAGRRYNRLVVR